MKEKIKPKISWKKLLLILLVGIFIAVVTSVYINNDMIKEKINDVRAKAAKSYSYTINFYLRDRESDTTYTLIKSQPVSGTAYSNLTIYGSDLYKQYYVTNGVTHYKYMYSDPTSLYFSSINITTTMKERKIALADDFTKNLNNSHVYEVKASGDVINIHMARQEFSRTLNCYNKSTNALIQSTTIKFLEGKAYTWNQLAPSISGYTLEGGTDSMSEESTGSTPTYTRYYTPNNYTLTVNHYKDGTSTALTSATTTTVAFGTTLDPSSQKQTITGYTYNNAKNSSNTVISSYTQGAGNATINLYYTPNNYTVTFNHYENGTSTKVFTSAHTVSKAYNSSITLADFKKTITGYNYTKATLSTNTSSAITSHTVTGNVTINMYYTKKNNLTYTINYRYLNGSNKVAIPGKTSLTGSNQTYGATLNLATYATAIPGYRFAYIHHDGTLLSGTTTTIKDTTNVIDICYDNIGKVAYTVNYLEYGTNAVVHPADSSPNGDYGTTINSKNDCYIDLSENGYYFCYIRSQNKYKIKNQSKIKSKEVEI